MAVYTMKYAIEKGYTLVGAVPFMCVYFNRLLYSSHKLKHNSLTGEIIWIKNPL